MNDLAQIAGIDDLLRRAGAHESNFEDAYQTLLRDPTLHETAKAVEHKVREYFARLRLPPHVTLYDELLLSLRPKDLIATFNWDPLLAQAYQRNRAIQDLPRMVFLHGSVAVGQCVEHRVKGFNGQPCRKCGKKLAASPLLYPIRSKNYEADPFIANEWAELTTAIGEAYLLNIFGYSAPTSDTAARSLLLETWAANPTRELAEVFIIDIRPREELETQWSDFFVRNHYGISKTIRTSWIYRHPRRSCDHFAMATLQNDPCAENPLPDLQELWELQEWFAPLIEEERQLLDKGTPFPC